MNKMINVGCPHLNYVLSAGYCTRGIGRGIFSFNMRCNKILRKELKGKIYWTLLYEKHVVCLLRNMYLLISLQDQGSSPVFSGFLVVHIFIFLCCVVSFVCLRSLSFA